MAQQEIGIRLKADTSDAVKSVQDLERQISGMESLENKGNAAEGFLSRKDVDEFKRMSDEAERVHRSFQENLDRSARELENKRKEMSAAQQRGASESTTSSIQREIDDLAAQRSQFEQAQQRAQTQMNRHQQTTETVSQYDTEPGGIMGNIYAMGRGTVGSMAGMIGGVAVASQMYQGMGQIKSQEAQASQLGQRIEGVDGDYTQFRRSAADTGRLDGNAYSTEETLQAAEQYSALAGAESQAELWENTNQIQTGARVMGLDPNLLATQYGGLSQMGGLSDKASIKDFQEGMVGAIKETGMDGRDAEFTQAVTGLADQVGRGQMEFGNAELNQILGLQTLLGQTGEPGLQGQRGADVLGNIDAAVKGGDNRLDLLLGWGTEYTGLEGRAELERLKAGGIGDPKLMQSLMTNMETSFGGDKDMMALFMKDAFGISMEQADALLEDETFNQLKQGKMSDEELSKIVEDGTAEVEKRASDWGESEAQQRAENDADWSETQRTLGFLPDRIWENVKDVFTSMPTELQAASLVGGGMLGGKALTAGMGGLGKLFGGGTKVGDFLGGDGKGKGPKGMLGGLGERAKNLGKGTGGMLGKLKGAGRVLGPAATLMTVDQIASDASGNMFDAIGDWAFGYEEGDVKRSEQGTGNFFSDDPTADPRRWDEVSDDLKHTETKKGVFGRAWDWITGGGDEAEGGGAATEALEPEGFQGITPLINANDPNDPRRWDEVSDDLKHTESRKGIFGRAWDWITGGGDEEEANGGGAATEALEPAGFQGISPLINANDPNDPVAAGGEGEVINARRALLAEQGEQLTQEKKNIDEKKGLLGLGGFGTSALMGIAGEGSSGGGILGAVFSNLFSGILDGDGGSGTGGTSVVDGGDLTQQSLKAGATMSAEEVDEWIASKAPSNSLFQGKGSAFVQAAQESGLDVRYLVSHAAHETAWGTSNIAREKGNMYGIGAFDASPYESAYGYNSTDAGIIEGAKWIAENYANKGQDTLESMRHNNGVHEYATDPQWHTKIANIMKGAGGFGGGAATTTVEVVVSGAIDNLTPENNDKVADALRSALLNETSYNLGTNYQQGVGGDR